MEIIENCKKCNKPIKVIITLMGEKKEVKSLCECDLKEIEKMKNMEKQREIDRMKAVCFQDKKLRDIHFKDLKEKTDMEEPCKKYVSKFKELKKSGKGLLITGGVGAGKSYIATCICNELIDKGYKCLFTSLYAVANRLLASHEKEDILRDINTYDLVVFDDFGAERKTEYMNEIVFNIIDSRYKSGKPFIVTTNLTSKDFNNLDFQYKRVLDRLLEVCIIVKTNHDSFRITKAIENKKLLI